MLSVDVIHSTGDTDNDSQQETARPSELEGTGITERPTRAIVAQSEPRVELGKSF